MQEGFLQDRLAPWTVTIDNHCDQVPYMLKYTIAEEVGGGRSACSALSRS